MKAKALLALLAAAAALCGIGAARHDAKAQAAPTLTELIDHSFAEVWKRDGISPSKASSDEEFLRRVYLDVAGELPTRAEAAAFFNDTRADKRARLIEQLLADKRFGQHLADQWTVILAKRGQDAGFNSARDLLAVWLAEQFNQNVGFGEITQQLITAKGHLSDNPAAAYYVLMGEPRPSTADMAGLTLKHFSGVQIQCAQCHKHPYEEKLTQEVFGGVASFFNATDIKYDYTVLPLDPRIVDEPTPPKRALEGYLKGKNVDAEVRNRIEEMMRYTQPQLPDDKPVKARDVETWRPMVASWLTSRRNETVRQYLANRFWSFLLGNAFVTPVDDFNSFNKAALPELLAALGKDFQQSGYDVKRFYRGVLNSRVYQLSSTGAPRNAQPWHFASYPVRQVSPEVFFANFFVLIGGDAFIRSFERQTTSAIDKLRAYAEFIEAQKAKDPKGEYPKFNRPVLEKYERLIKPMDAKWQIRRGLASKYATLTADDEMSEAEGFSLTIDQALEVMNGDVTRRIGGSLNGTLLFELFEETKDDAERVRQLYLAVLTRQPSEPELKRALEFISTECKTRKDAQIYEDVFFALVSTTEFATNH
ncbi:MAG: DUF1549 domain-containing protein [Planctomycetes bacterium]|jgi:hypothetical protein|nr:DUF1549 domain-containing protein [Planctomycetota bacterium]